MWPIDYPSESHPSHVIASFLTHLNAAEDLLQELAYSQSVAKQCAHRYVTY